MDSDPRELSFVPGGDHASVFTGEKSRSASFPDPDVATDPAFDGDPVQVYEPGEDDPVVPPEPDPATQTPVETGGDDGDAQILVDPDRPGPGTGQTLPKYYIHGRPVRVATERIEYLDADGRLVTESLRDYSRKAIRAQYASLDQFLRRWNGEERKDAIIAELAAEGLPMLNSKLSSSVKIRESHQSSQPMVYLDPKHKLSQEFVALYQELSGR